MARDLAPEVERLLQFRDPNIRKKVSVACNNVQCFNSSDLEVGYIVMCLSFYFPVRG